MTIHTVDYLLSVQMLEALKEKKLITEEEFEEIDALNQQTFL